MSDLGPAVNTRLIFQSERNMAGALERQNLQQLSTKPGSLAMPGDILPVLLFAPRRQCKALLDDGTFGRLARTVGIIGLDRRVPLVMLALLPRDVDAATDVADFKHLIAQEYLLAFPRA